MVADWKSHNWSYDRSFGATIDRTIGRRSKRSVARCYDWSCDWSLHPTIDLRSTVVCHNWSYTRPQDAKSARTIGRRMQRLILPSVAGRHDRSYDRSPRLIVRSVVGRNNWSYIGSWSLPLVARFPTMALAIDMFVSFVIARPRVEINWRMRPLLGDRSKHCRSFAPWPNRNQSYDSEIVRSNVTVALVARRLHVIIIWLLFPEWHISYRSSLYLDNVIFHSRLSDRNYGCRRRPRYLIFSQFSIYCCQNALASEALPRTPPGGFQRPQLANVGSHHWRGPHRIAGPRAPRPHDPPLGEGVTANKKRWLPTWWRRLPWACSPSRANWGQGGKLFIDIRC